jgi:hypothetical protein
VLLGGLKQILKYGPRTQYRSSPRGVNALASIFFKGEKNKWISLVSRQDKIATTIREEHLILSGVHFIWTKIGCSNIEMVYIFTKLLIGLHYCY